MKAIADMVSKLLAVVVLAAAGLRGWQLLGERGAKSGRTDQPFLSTVLVLRWGGVL